MKNVRPLRKRPSSFQEAQLYTQDKQNNSSTPQHWKVLAAVFAAGLLDSSGKYSTTKTVKRKVMGK